MPNRRGTGPLLSPLTWPRSRKPSALSLAASRHAAVPATSRHAEWSVREPSQARSRIPVTSPLGQGLQVQVRLHLRVGPQELAVWRNQKAVTLALARASFPYLIVHLPSVGQLEELDLSFSAPSASLYRKNTIKYTESCVQLYKIE